MSTFVNTVDVVGDEALTASIIDRSITEIKDSNVTSIGFAAFRACTALTTADFLIAKDIGHYAFNGCTSLVALILRQTTTVGTLGSNDPFTSTPIWSGTGYIYVPRALVDSYKTKSQWSRVSSKYRALEDYTVDGTTTGELDPTKTGG